MINVRHLALVAQSRGSAENDPGFTIFMFMCLGLIVLVIASVWALFSKAGQPGWAAIIPIYNAIVMLQIAGKPVWWIILLAIPVVNFVVWIVVMIDLAKNFGKGTGFGLGLAFLGFIFLPVLGFGDAPYQPVTAT